MSPTVCTFDPPARSLCSSQLATVLSFGFLAIAAMRADQFDSALGQPISEGITIGRLVVDQKALFRGAFPTLSLESSRAGAGGGCRGRASVPARHCANRVLATGAGKPRHLRNRPDGCRAGFPLFGLRTLFTHRGPGRSRGPYRRKSFTALPVGVIGNHKVGNAPRTQHNAAISS